jgi:hypothetical protein
VRNKQAAIVLGKALFWDVAAGSDGMACASCHFHAGADSRVKNQLNPGLLAGDQTFNPTASGAAGGPNYTLRLQIFPFISLPIRTTACRASFHDQRGVIIIGHLQRRVHIRRGC